MTSSRVENFDKARGLRLKRFRTEILDISQKDLALDRDVSQSKMSMIERGQMPDDDLIKFYTDSGINWNWVMNGNGPLQLNGENGVVNEEPINYRSITEIMDYLDSDDPIDVFFKDLENMRDDILFRIKTASDLSDVERDDLYKKLVSKIFEKAKKLKNSY
jgi:DNA-binding XRE family transcriptional regulator